MKKFIITTVVFILLGMLIGGIGFALGTKPDDIVNYFYIDEQYGEKITEIIPDETKKIKLDLTDRALEVRPSKTGEAYIEYYIYEKFDRLESFAPNSENDYLLSFSIFDVTEFPWFQIQVSNCEKRMVNIYLPPTHLIDLEIRAKATRVLVDGIDVLNLLINGDSSHVDVINMKAQSLKVNNSSGGIYIGNVKIDNAISLTSSSGRVDCSRITGDEITVASDSGTIDFEKVTFDTLTLTNLSGNILGKEITGISLDAKTSSGKILIENHQVQNNTLTTSSGKIVVTDFRESSLIGFIAKTSSGKITVFGERFQEKSDDLSKYVITYTMKTSSGSISVA